MLAGRGHGVGDTFGRLADAFGDFFERRTAFVLLHKLLQERVDLAQGDDAAQW